MSFLDKLERKYGRYSIKNLMVGIVLVNIFVYILRQISGINLSEILIFNRDKILDGEVWRLVTFIFALENEGLISFALGTYFSYMSGLNLELEWGSFRFNFYYLVGMITTIIIGFITGFEINGYYINLSLFLAFAKLFPNVELLLMYIIPIKVKYLGMLNWVIIILSLIGARSLMEILVKVIPLINYFIFFGKDNFFDFKYKTSHGFRKRDFKRKVKPNLFNHQCEICKITDKDDNNMEFRYCTKCSDVKCYCKNHINNHEHI